MTSKACRASKKQNQAIRGALLPLNQQEKRAGTHEGMIEDHAIPPFDAKAPAKSSQDKGFSVDANRGGPAISTSKLGSRKEGNKQQGNQDSKAVSRGASQEGGEMTSTRNVLDDGKQLSSAAQAQSMSSKPEAIPQHSAAPKPPKIDASTQHNSPVSHTEDPQKVVTQNPELAAAQTPRARKATPKGPYLPVELQSYNKKYIARRGQSSWHKRGEQGGVTSVCWLSNAHGSRSVDVHAHALA